MVSDGWSKFKNADNHQSISTHKCRANTRPGEELCEQRSSGVCHTTKAKSSANNQVWDMWHVWAWAVVENGIKQSQRMKEETQFLICGFWKIYFCRQNSVKPEKQVGKKVVSPGRYWKPGLRVFVVSEYILSERDTHPDVRTYEYIYCSCYHGIHREEPPTPHYAFLHHESLYHNSGICQGADVLPDRVLTGWRKPYCRHI